MAQVILSRTYNLNMRNIRKQLHLLSNLAQTVLQYRLDPFQGLHEHIRDIRKKIRQMIMSQIYEQGISQMLVSKDSYQIKNKVAKLAEQIQKSQLRQICVQIRISAIEKYSCQIYNQQLWEFGILINQANQFKKIDLISGAVVELMQFVLKHLQYCHMLPLNKQRTNRYMLNHKVIIAQKASNLPIYKYENMASHQATFIRQHSSNLNKIIVKYYYNDRKTQESLKQIIMNRSFQTSENSKKNSTDSTDTSRRVSLYQYYDDQLDITILSGSDQGQQRCQEVLLNIPVDQQDDQFQLLIEETVNDDELFLKDNLNIFKDFNCLQDNYFHQI